MPITFCLCVQLPIICSSGSKGRAPTLSVQIFMQFSAKILEDNGLANPLESLRPYPEGHRKAAIALHLNSTFFTSFFLFLLLFVKILRFFFKFCSKRTSKILVAVLGNVASCLPWSSDWSMYKRQTICQFKSKHIIYYFQCITSIFILNFNLVSIMISAPESYHYASFT